MMKRFKLFPVLAMVWAMAGLVHGGEEWMTDLEEAKAVAKEEGKAVMVEFTGSDWCPPCMMMNAKVFSKEAFLTGAAKNFILVKLDMPKAKDKAEMKAANEKLMMEFGVKGVPTVILLDREGEEFSRFTASKFPSVEGFLEHLERQLLRKDMF